MNYRIYPEGIDCVWVAVDRVGYLAIFVTAGQGPIPKVALDTDAIAIESIEEYIYTLPKISNAKLLIAMPRPDDFIAMAERGFFVYDWRDMHRSEIDYKNCYELIAIPESPLIMRNMIPDTSVLLTNIRLNKTAYVDSQKIDIPALIECFSTKTTGV
jgi:hypothetical protein